MMSIQSILTGVALHIPFIAIVWDDGQYGLIKWKQEMNFHKHSHTELIHSDLAEIAKAMSCHTKRITTTHDFKPALNWALTNQNASTVLVVPVDYSENMKLFYHLKNAVK